MAEYFDMTPFLIAAGTEDIPDSPLDPSEFIAPFPFDGKHYVEKGAPIAAPIMPVIGGTDFPQADYFDSLALAGQLPMRL